MIILINYINLGYSMVNLRNDSIAPFMRARGHSTIATSQSEDCLISVQEPINEDNNSSNFRKALKIGAIALGAIAVGFGIYYAASRYWATPTQPTIPVIPQQTPVIPQQTISPQPSKPESLLPSCLSISPSDPNLALGKQTGEHSPKIALFTSFTTDKPDRLKMSDMVSENQCAYAADKGYDYLVYRQNLAFDVDPATGKKETWLPYWSKVAAINKILNDQEPNLSKNKPEWIVWLDDDAAITNKNIKIEDIISHYAPKNSDINFFVTEDSMSRILPNVPLNSGVLFIKNNDWSQKFFKEVWDMRKVVIPGHSYTYGNCPNQECLHDQQAITEVMRSDNFKWKQHIKVIPQRDYLDPTTSGWGINTFHRWSHYDDSRKFKINYDIDKLGTHWRKNDFIGQCTGLALNLRLGCIEELITNNPKPHY